MVIMSFDHTQITILLFVLAIYLFIDVIDRFVNICVATNDVKNSHLLSYLLVHNHFLSINIVSLTS